MLIFVVLFFLSGPFEYGAEQDRPVLLVVGLLILAAILAYFGVGFACRVPKAQHKKLQMLVFGLALSIRLVAMFTSPILEIDYYRYIWDGKVVCEGVSPYRFSPDQVLASSISLDKDLDRLVNLSTRAESNHVALSRIHFGDYTTLYPPVSQLVFAAAMKLTPEATSVDAHVAAIKIAMTSFDVATMLLIAGLLVLARKHPGWLIAYAWNPLVIKEIANSGHLDSIATFFVVLTLYLIARQKIVQASRSSQWSLAFAGVALGMGVGAKLYPVVLFPVLLFALLGRKRPFGHRFVAGANFSAAFALTTCFVLFPMFQDKLNDLVVPSRHEVASEQLPSAGAEERVVSRDGLGGFFSSWRMNDPVFSTVYFNLKNDFNASTRPWFVFTSQSWRDQLNGQFQNLGFEGMDPAYLMARIVTLSLFFFFYLWQLGSLCHAETQDDQWIASLLLKCTLILAMFLFVQPTVNPWYFVWIAPMACLINNRGWLLASGILMIYYSRFWFESLVGTYAVGSASLSGAKLFDHYFVFVEFGLILVVLTQFKSRKSLAEPRRIHVAAELPSDLG